MDWLPENANFLTVFGAVLAGCATLTGIVVTLGQFTAGARARRTIDWTSSALDFETDGARRQMLSRLQHRAQGRLVGMHYIPAWRFAEAFVFTVLAPLSLVLSAQDGGGSGVGAVAFGLVTLALVFRRAIRLYAERERVAHQFEAGGIDVEPVRVDILEQMEGGTRREFSLGAISAVAVMATGGLVAWGFVSEHDDVAWPGVALALFACWSCFQITRTYARDLANKPPPHAAKVKVRGVDRCDQ